MMTRTRRQSIVFNRPFLIKGIDRLLPSGAYEVVTDEELIEGLSFPVYRRVSTMIFVPAQSQNPSSSIEMLTIDPRELQVARDRDIATHPGPAV